MGKKANSEVAVLNLADFKPSPEARARMLYNRMQISFSNSEDPRIPKIIWENGPITERDRKRNKEIREISAEIFKHEWIPKYHERCRQEKIPEKYWVA